MAETTPKLMPDFDDDESSLHDLLGKPAPSCPPLDILLAYRDDVLPPVQAEVVGRHFAECRLCPALLADFDTLPEPQLSAAQLDRIRTTLPSSAQQERSKALLYSFIGIAAALIIATFLIFGWHARSAPAPSMASAVPPALPAPVACVEIPISPLAPPEGMLTRGAQPTEDPSIDTLMPAFSAYNRGDYATAADRFTKLQSGYPHSDLVLLYLGVSQLFLHQDAKAYTTLTRPRRLHADSADAMHWYAAVAAERTHATNAAQLFAEICTEKSSRWSAESCKIESQLH